MRFHARTCEAELDAGTRTPRVPDAEQERGRLELAGSIGNVAMQRVARSPELQRSPAAAGLVGPTIARSPLEQIIGRPDSLVRVLSHSEGEWAAPDFAEADPEFEEPEPPHGRRDNVEELERLVYDRLVPLLDAETVRRGL